MTKKMIKLSTIFASAMLLVGMISCKTIPAPEGMIPSEIDPWTGSFERNWSMTDAEFDAKRTEELEKSLEQHIKNISDVTDVSVKINIPETKLFTEDQEPVTAEVKIQTTPESDLLTNQNRLDGIQRFVLSAVEGLKAENLVICDSDGTKRN